MRRLPRPPLQMYAFMRIGQWPGLMRARRPSDMRAIDLTGGSVAQPSDRMAFGRSQRVVGRLWPAATPAGLIVACWAPGLAQAHRAQAAVPCGRVLASSAATSPCNASSMDQQGLNELKDEEGLRDHPYNDSRGYCTIGVGHLLHKSKCTAQDRQAWSNVSDSQLLQLFRQDVGRFENLMNAFKAKLHLALNPCQYDALLSLLFNGGTSWFISPKSRMYRALKRGDFAAVPKLIQEAVPAKANRKTKAALQNRRMREAAEFKTPYCCVGGTFGGVSHLDGIMTTWHGTVQFATRQGGNAYSTGLGVSSGSLSLTISGTDGNGCTWSGTGSFSLTDAEVIGNITIQRDGTYTASITTGGQGPNPDSWFPVTMSCPGQTPMNVSWGYANWLDTGTPLPKAHGIALDGSYAFGISLSGTSWHWTLTSG